VPDDIKHAAIAHFAKADPEYGAKVRATLGL